MTRKNLLFVTPVLPSLNRRGRNFRAYQWVWRLQEDYQVSVLCTSVYGETEVEEDESIQKLDCKIFSSDHKYSLFQRLKNLMMFKPSTWNEVGGVMEKEMQKKKVPKPDYILCFRIQNASTALYLSKAFKAEKVWLDIDEVDSRVKYDIARQMMKQGYVGKGMKEWMEATLYSIQERQLVSEFDTIYTSTGEEKNNLQQFDGTENTEVFGNMLPVLNRHKSVTPSKGPFTFMFVGDSNYFPNLDAINFLLFDIIPKLEKVTKNPFKFIIIGGFLGRRQHKQISTHDCITYYQDSEDLKNIYEQSNAVIVPLRVGGGSSLKFLEALRFKKPVVATHVGARGFDIKSGVQALIGEDTSGIVQHCQTLMRDRDFACELSEKGHQWFLENHSFEVEMKEEFEEVY